MDNKTGLTHWILCPVFLLLWRMTPTDKRRFWLTHIGGTVIIGLYVQERSKCLDE